MPIIIIKFFQRGQIENIDFPNVIDIIHSIWISEEAFSEGSMQRVCILRL